MRVEKLKRRYKVRGRLQQPNEQRQSMPAFVAINKVQLVNLQKNVFIVSFT